MASAQEAAFKCALPGDVESPTQPLEGEGEPREQGHSDKRDECGRSALLTAAMLGQWAVVGELVRHGGRVNEQTVRGYSALHLAACWGHAEAVRTLLELDADTQARTFRGQTPADLARRYSRTDCVDCLVLAEAKQDLVSYLAFVKDVVSERSLTKEDKNMCARVCAAKSDWMQSAKLPTVSDFAAQRKEMEDSVQPVLSKLSVSASEMPVKPAETCSEDARG
ncbi:hypothetical protein F2P81_001125 [Scophthalmus maximus]|uniref:Uncharacterized protein n=1 Tax=Scophthalmus maximus TaxID=52904 RepID=A0A6A4TZM7_SCOMX|nr:hypothetical protein F2P81_001125 [Scophthalmus maximus]